MVAHEERCNGICVCRIMCCTLFVYRHVPCHFLNSVAFNVAEDIKISIACYEATYSSQGTLYLSSR